MFRASKRYLPPQARPSRMGRSVGKSSQIGQLMRTATIPFALGVGAGVRICGGRTCHSRSSENQRVRDFAVMQVQEIWCAVVGFERSQILRTEMIVRLFAGKDRKQKRQ